MWAENSGAKEEKWKAGPQPPPLPSDDRTRARHATPPRSHWIPAVTQTPPQKHTPPSPRGQRLAMPMPCHQACRLQGTGEKLKRAELLQSERPRLMWENANKVLGLVPESGSTDRDPWMRHLWQSVWEPCHV